MLERMTSFEKEMLHRMASLEAELRKRIAHPGGVVDGLVRQRQQEGASKA